MSKPIRTDTLFELVAHLLIKLYFKKFMTADSGHLGFSGRGEVYAKNMHSIIFVMLKIVEIYILFVLLANPVPEICIFYLSKWRRRPF